MKNLFKKAAVGIVVVITIIFNILSNNTEQTTYSFRNDSLLQEHFEKHGSEMGCSDIDDYLQRANDVINNPNSLHKIEQEDGDDVYYLEESNELVILSTDGYIRTYFLPDDGIKFFEKQ